MKYIFNFSLILALTIILIGSSTNYKHTESVSSNRNKNLSTHKKLYQIIDEKRTLSEFKSVSIFNFSSNASENDNSASFVNSASLMNISKRYLEKALNSKDENILFSIPVSGNEDLELELTLSFPASDDFILTAKDGISEKRVSYTPGLHYNGIIKGKNNSIASLSIYKNFVMGIISDQTGNYVLGSVRNSDNSHSDQYIFYNDSDLKVKDNYKCGVEDYEEKFTRTIEESKNNFSANLNSDNPARLPVKIYFEADYQFYVDAGNSTESVANFINGMFNSVKTIYQNEGIPFEVSRIGVWTAPDPYRNLNDSYLILLKFGEANKDDFQGNLAHFLSTRNAGLGGIAWIRVMCAEYSARDSSGRFAFSNIEPNYNNFPAYSWTVNVVAHEMGHSMGSRHTHACWWPAGPGGAIRAIDSCFTNENCSFPTRPRVGTIMSYCHLYPASQGGGINLASGFGQLPGDTIRLRYSQAGCLDRVVNSSERPTSFDLYQNFPNPYNPSTIVRFALPNETNVSLKVYDVNGRLVADLLQNKFYSPGFYDYEFNSSLYGLSSGIYFYRIVAGGFAETKRMVLIK
ncbi:MAG: M12 family metallo-peptidase [Bacteroidota bacterium]|nr:M12 family metallo-peptidase [Bacteroidota bacterium]